MDSNKVLELAIERSKEQNDQSLFVSLANICVLIGDVEKSKTCIQQAINLPVKKYSALYGLAWIKEQEYTVNEMKNKITEGYDLLVKTFGQKECLSPTLFELDLPHELFHSINFFAFINELIKNGFFWETWELRNLFDGPGKKDFFLSLESYVIRGGALHYLKHITDSSLKNDAIHETFQMEAKIKTALKENNYPDALSAFEKVRKIKHYHIYFREHTIYELLEKAVQKENVQSHNTAVILKEYISHFWYEDDKVFILLNHNNLLYLLEKIIQWVYRDTKRISPLIQYTELCFKHGLTGDGIKWLERIKLLENKLIDNDKLQLAYLLALSGQIEQAKAIQIEHMEAEKKLLIAMAMLHNGLSEKSMRLLSSASMLSENSYFTSGRGDTYYYAELIVDYYRAGKYQTAHQCLALSLRFIKTEVKPHKIEMSYDMISRRLSQIDDLFKLTRHVVESEIDVFYFMVVLNAMMINHKLIKPTILDQMNYLISQECIDFKGVLAYFYYLSGNPSKGNIIFRDTWNYILKTDKVLSSEIALLALWKNKAEMLNVKHDH